MFLTSPLVQKNKISGVTAPCLMCMVHVGKGSLFIKAVES